MPRAPRAKRKPGRPHLGDKGRTQVLAIKISADERRAWGQRAEQDEITLSQWVRARCNQG